MQVESDACFGQGAVRAHRVLKAVASASLKSWVFAIVFVGAVAGVGVVIAVLAEQIATLNTILEKVASAIAVAALPITIVRWLFTVSPSCV